MTTSQYLILAICGMLAGAINAAVGSGTMITYPALLSVGLPPVVANGTNTAGIFPGSISGAWVYRHRLRGRRRQLRNWAIGTTAGAALGALLVVVLPATVFEAVVPWLILSACVVVALQPLILRWSREWRASQNSVGAAVAGVGVYGGYFGAGQGIAYLAVLTAMDDDDVQQANATKQILMGCANAASAVVFALAGQVMWIPALVMGVCTLVGGAVGGGLAKRLPAWALRIVIVLVGLYATYKSFTGL